MILLCIEGNEFLKNLPTRSLDGEIKHSQCFFGFDMNNLSVALKLRMLEKGPKTLNMICSPRWISDGRRSVQYGKWKTMAT